MTDPSSPDSTRLWREESQEPIPSPRQAPSRAGLIFAVVAVMLALIGGLVGLLSWVRTVPSPVFVPFWVTAYEARQIPSLAAAVQDRAALSGTDYFPRERGQAATSQERHLLLQELLALKNQPAGESVVVSLCAHARRDGKGNVCVLPADADPDNPETWLPLQRVLELLKDCPAQHKLLLLDLMQPLASLRLGVLGNDVAEGVAADVEAVNDPDLLVLCACAPGQVSLTSEALGRSVFSYYVEEGLRGRADFYPPDGKRDGHISVHELASFVRARVDRWAGRNRDTRQTPWLLGSGKNFLLRAVDHSQAPEPRGLPAVPAYPAWLLSAWKIHDQSLLAGHFRRTPQLFRQQEALLLQAERDWRGGMEEARIRQNQIEAFERLQASLAGLQVLPAPEPKSLALAATLGAKRDEALATDLQQLFIKMKEGTELQKPEEAVKVRAKLAQEFQDKLKGKSAFQLGSAVFESAATDDKPGAEKVRILDGLLRASQADPEPAFVETLLLRHLAELAGQAETVWPTDTVRRLLQVTRAGEKAAGQPRVFPWVAHLLEQTAQDRHDAEVRFWARGYASLQDADRLLQDAAAGYEAVLTHVKVIQDAQAAYDEAMAFLPAYLPYLEVAPDHHPTWLAAVETTQELYGSLIPPPDVPAQMRTRVKEIQQHTSALREHLQGLRQPFTKESVARLQKLSQLPQAKPAVCLEIDAVLATPFVPADDRAALWKAGLELARRLHAATLELDQDEDGTQEPTAALPEYDQRRAVFAEQERARQRARRSIALLKLAGLSAGAVLQLEDAFTQAAPEQAAPATRCALGNALRQAWGRQLSEQFNAAPSPFARDRLSRLLPPLDNIKILEAGETTATVDLLSREAQGLWSWLADRYRYEARDYRNAGVDPALSRFYAQAANAYQALGRPPRESYAEVQGGQDLPRLTPASPQAALTLQLRLVRPAAAPAPRVSLLTADSDWLLVRPTSAQPPVKPDPSEPSLYQGVLPVRLELKPNPERSPSPRPRGLLVQTRLENRSFHTRVDVPIESAGEQVLLLLSGNPRRPEPALRSVRLRPRKVEQPYYLYVRNPGDRARKLTVQLKVKGELVPGGEVGLKVDPVATAQVRFGEKAPGKEGLPPLQGPLQLVLLDADSGKVLDQVKVEVDIASPQEYVRVTDIQFDPGVQGKNRLAVTLQTQLDMAGADIPVELVLPRQRIPALVAYKDGTFTGELKLEPGKVPDPLTLYAQNLQLAPAADEEGYFYLNVDGYERCFIFRTSFARQGNPVAPRGDGRPAVRLRTPRHVLAGPKYGIDIEVDNPPAGAALEFSFGRLADGVFEPDTRTRFADAKDRQIGFWPQGPAGALLFDASIKDRSVQIDASKILGRRLVMARLLDETGQEIQQAVAPVTLDNSPPERVKLVGLPKAAKRGTELVVRALGGDPESGIAEVFFFLGKLEDGKVPPKTPLVSGAAVGKDGTTWAARLTLPEDRKGPVPVTVQFVNQVGLSTFDTAVIDLTEGEPGKTGLGRIAGAVMEGPRTQPNLDVTLKDAKGVEKAKTKSKADGTFVFEGLPPGAYRVYSVKPASQRRGSREATVTGDETTKVTIELTL